MLFLWCLLFLSTSKMNCTGFIVTMFVFFIVFFVLFLFFLVLLLFSVFLLWRIKVFINVYLLTYLLIVVSMAMFLEFSNERDNCSLTASCCAHAITRNFCLCAICKLHPAIWQGYRIRVGLWFGSVLRSGPGLGLSLMLGLGSGLSQKFVTGACAITKLRNAFCKLGRLTNREQHRTLKF